MFINATIKNLGRIKKLVEVLLKYGFEDFVINSGLNRIFKRKKKTREYPQEPEQNRWTRLRMVMEELGPTFIKLGQMLSNRPDLLPEPLIKEFEKLQDDVAPFDVEDAKRIIEEETGSTIEELYQYFDDKSIGSASIGQVHRARLQSGEDVVIKVQRPNARREIKADLALIREFVKLTENFFIKAGILNPLDIVDAFSKSLNNELDYRAEARNLEQFSVLLKEYKKLYIPKLYKEFSTRKILTIEFIGGCKVSDVRTIRSWGLDPKDIAKRGLDIYLTQIFDFGIFHADPHPGNVFIKPNGTIVLLDYGMIGRIAQSQKYAFAGMFISLAKNDAVSMATNLRRLAIDHDIVDTRELEHDLNEIIQDYMFSDNMKGRIQEFTASLQKLAYKYKLKVPGEIFLILRSLAILEGVAYTLDPKFDVMKNIKPFGIRLIAQQYSLKNLKSEVSHSLLQTYTLFYNLPLEIRDIIKQVRQGKITIHTKPYGFDKYLRLLDFLANRFVLGLIISVLILSSALVYSRSLGLEIKGFLGIPYFSWICWIISGFLLLIYIINDFLSKRNRG